jgi:hypothetical protein
MLNLWQYEHLEDFFAVFSTISPRSRILHGQVINR